ncbi:hypothetical protein PIROE2DRAFT_2855 [Piromyces sp. E2]|nr:hypothetical protein PIROE2DRAFT_2855 [Piromyces sp. E2]|eukprot:OUM69164.1 hypothetical protein PIROE2DRAFT_2855 [Piromyces sp. E2]
MLNRTLSRYIRIFYIQRLSIFKLKFSEKKNENIRKKGDQVLKKLEFMNTKSISSKGSDTIDSFSNEAFEIENINISNPNDYFKKLNKIINKRIKMSVPKLILNIVVVIHSIYMLNQAYRKQKWDIELRIEYTAFIIVIIFCSVFMSLSMNSVFGDTIFKYRLYVFQLIPITVHCMSIIEPLIKVLIHKIKKREKMLSEEEFLNQLSDTNFKNQVKDIATQTFCIENILFFEGHYDLMNIVVNYYNKKNPSESNNQLFLSSDVLHKSKINPILNGSFDTIFKPQFEQIYLLYIKEDGIASININGNIISTIENQIENNNFTYLMFFEKRLEHLYIIIYIQE